MMWSRSGRRPETLDEQNARLLDELVEVRRERDRARDAVDKIAADRLRLAAELASALAEVDRLLMARAGDPRDAADWRARYERAERERLRERENNVLLTERLARAEDRARLRLLPDDGVMTRAMLRVRGLPDPEHGGEDS